MKFIWDEAKRKKNMEKHKIDFKDVINVFNNPYLSWIDDREDYGELREILIGDTGQTIVVVVYIDKENKTIRIISARRATKHERKLYEQRNKENF